MSRLTSVLVYCVLVATSAAQLAHAANGTSVPQDERERTRDERELRQDGRERCTDVRQLIRGAVRH